MTGLLLIGLSVSYVGLCVFECFCVSWMICYEAV